VAYRIINNVIYIGAGETATYDVRVIDRSTGAPYILPVDNTNNVVISFVVRPSVYGKSADPVIKKYIILKEDLKLDTNIIYDYVATDWDDEYTFQGGTQPAIKAVYKRLLPDGSGYEYRHYDPDAETDKWKPYEFRLTFPFYHEDTIDLAPKQYKYEIALFAGPELTIVGDEKKSLHNFNYKEILMSHTDFIVEGALSE
jgi:hypothetical protein